MVVVVLWLGLGWGGDGGGGGSGGVGWSGVVMMVVVGLVECVQLTMVHLPGSKNE